MPIRRPSLLWLAALSALFSASPALAQKKPITLETVYRPPSSGGFAPAPIWSPDGKSYLAERQGKLMLMEPGKAQGRELVTVKDLEAKALEPSSAGPFDWENRRVREQRIQWSGDGKNILMHLNGDVFLVNAASGQWDQLTATRDHERDPKLSPDGRRLAYRKQADLYVLDLASRKVTRLTSDGSPTLLNGQLDWVYPEELDLGTAYWWAPDSQSIAYLQFDVSKIGVYSHVDLLKVEGQPEPERYPKAGTPNSTVRLGAVSAKGGKTRWLDAGDSKDYLFARVHWHPSASEVWVERLTRIQNRHDLIALDAKSGKARVLRTEEDPYWINISDDLRLLEGGKRVLFSSEKTGFRHLYLGDSAALNEAKPLTSGDWQVNGIVCVNAAEVFYTSTEASPLEQQLYAVSLTGGPRRRVTRGEGWHSVNMAPGCAVYSDSHSSLQQPPRRAFHRADGSELELVREADRKILDEYEIRPTEIHQVKAADGATMYARLIKPAGFDPARKYPAIVMVYGGPHAQTVRNAWPGLTWDQALAHKGFVIWQLDNRGSAGRGHLWESKVFRSFGKQELADQLTGVSYLTSLGFVDPQRIGMYGWSYGGYMTLYSLLNAPDTFAAGVAGAPVTDWRLYDTIYTERYMGLPQQNEAGYKASSPVHSAANLKAKLMIVHNIGDDNVLFQNAMMMMNALQLAGKPFESMIYPQKSHGVGGPARKHLLETTTQFFERHLAPSR